MAKARRGRTPFPRQRDTFFTGSAKGEKTFENQFKTLAYAFYSAKNMRANEMRNLFRYLLNTFDLDDVQTSLEVEGDGYDYTFKLTLGETTLEMVQFRQEVKVAA